MAGLWASRTGKPITGKFEDAVALSFEIIPEGTTAFAEILSIKLVEKEATQYGPEQKFYEISWKITDGSFKGRQVSQKLKVFNGTDVQVDRNLNMFKLVMNIFDFIPKHGNELTESELAPMVSKIAGIKIREWSMPKKDGSGMMEGNFVSEVSPTKDFKCETGVKAEVKHVTPDVAPGPDSAFSRERDRQKDEVLESDIPF